MPAILASLFVYNLQRTKDIVLTPDLSVLFVYQFADGKILIALFQFPKYHSTLLLSLSNIILSGNLYNFHILSQNNLTNPSADVSSVVTTKYIILDSLLQTTKIVFFPATNGNFVMKFTVKCVYSFSGTSLSLNFPTCISVLLFYFSS